MNQPIHTPKAPAAIGPYSQAVKAGNLVFVSGQIPVDPATGEFAGSDITTQTRQSLTNVRSILEQAGCSCADVVKTTCHKHCSGLPPGILREIERIKSRDIGASGV